MEVYVLQELREKWERERSVEIDDMKWQVI